jgi:hypothetical protein
MNLERLEWHLHNWSLMGDEKPKLGYPSKSSVMSGGGSSSEDEFNLMLEECDTKCAVAMDGIIDSLSQPQRVAIYHVWLGDNHYYPTQALDYDEAITNLLILAIKRKID